MLLLSAAPLLGRTAAPAQSVDDIISKTVDAIGGEGRVKTVNTQRIIATISFSGQDSGDLLVEFKRPNKIREEMMVGGKKIIRVYDGKAGWQINPYAGSDDPKWLSPEENKLIAEEAELEGPVIDYKQKGNKIELVGKESVNGSDAYKFKVMLKSGDVHYYYYDSKSYLKVKWEAARQIDGKNAVLESFFSDYRDIDGLKYPFLITSDTQGEGEGQRIVTKKVEINPAIDDSRFVFPSSH